MKKISAFFFLLVFWISVLIPEAYSQKVPAADIQNRISAEEAAIGEQIHQTILSSFYPYTEPRTVEYVNKIGSSLARHAERKGLPYKFTILYNDKIYATSSPGGHIYLTTGMIYFLGNESELAAILAHEIGELQYKDPKLSAGRKILQKVTEAGAMVAPAFGPFGMLAALGFAGVHAVAETTKKTPEQRVLSADRRALNYMVQAGYDPQAMVDLFYKFSSAPKEVIPYFYDYNESRPLTIERAAALQKRFNKLPLQGKSFDVHRQEYLEMTKGIREIYGAARGS